MPEEMTNFMSSSQKKRSHSSGLKGKKSQMMREKLMS